MATNRKKATRVGLGCFLMLLAAPLGLCPFVVMTGSNLQGWDGVIFFTSMVLSLILLIVGIVKIIRAGISG